MTEGMDSALKDQKDIAGKRKQVRDWIGRIQMSSNEEKDWRKTADKIFLKYSAKQARPDAFNILWSNTETLAPAIYNSVPKPDCRRRFRDADPIGKAVSEVQDRAITFSLDAYDFDLIARLDILDALICGRGISRVRYIPQFSESETENADAGDVTVDWESVQCEHVQWDDFRRDDEKTWAKVGWVAFRHDLDKEEITEKFSKEIADKLQYSEPDPEKYPEIVKQTDVSDSFKTHEVWEIWNKDGKEVIFLSMSYKEDFLKVVDDPLGLDGFFPIPRPLYTTLDTNSLIPIPLYETYKAQADELSEVSNRIQIITKALKVRGVYDSTLSELSDLFSGKDNAMIPAQNISSLIERGGLTNAIWFMPIDQIAKVLQQLYVQRENAKQVIYELTGISDIMRGSTNPNETLGAQEIKAQYGSGRLQSLQREVQRYLRDLIEIMGEIISNKFDIDTLKAMTNLKYPDSPEDIQQNMQQGGQAPQITWQDIMNVLRDPQERNYKVDIETDSTVAATIQRDMEGLQKVLTAIVEFINGIGPAVQSGAVPIEAVKEIISTIARRARLGGVVEDALDGIQAPQNGGEQALKAQMGQMQQQFQQKLQEAQNGAQMQSKMADINARMQIESARLQMEHENLSRTNAREDISAEVDARLRHYEDSIKEYQAEIQEYMAETQRLAALGGQAQAQLEPMDISAP